MADAISTGQVDSFIPELWGNEVLARLPKYLNMANTVHRDFEEEVAKMGDKVNVPKTGTLTATQKTANGDVTVQQPDDSEVEVALDDHYEVTFIVEDVAEAQSKLSVKDTYVSDAAVALAEKIEDLLYTEAKSNAGESVSAGASLAAADILSMRKKHVDNKVPKVEPKYFYVDSSGMNDLLQVDEFIDVNKYGESAQPLATGELGSIYGYRSFESQTVEGSGSPTSYDCVGYTRNALALVTRPLVQHGSGYGVKQRVVQDPELGIGMRVSASWNPTKLGLQVTIDTLFGVKTLRADHVVKVTHT
jgi:N4-gp56 family major capsid protein